MLPKTPPGGPPPKDRASATPTSVEGGAREQKKTGSVRPGGPASLIGMTLSGRYKIERLLGEGGMGAVYQAEQTYMKKRVAVKVLHAEMTRSPEVVERFKREAMAAAHIDHPNVAAATDSGQLEDGSFFLVLEYVEGHSLRDMIAKGRFDLGRALHVANQIAGALQRAHAQGIVHRDLKPENVMLVERDGDPDFVKVLDFGIAKVPMGEMAAAAAAASTGGAAPKVLTQMGMIYGTPEYMAPEQALGQPVDARADLYALGVLLYEMLAGSRPFDHESKVSLLGMHVTARVPPFSERVPGALIPPEVEAIVMRLLAKEASDRFDNAKELSDAIVNVLALLVERGRIEAPRAGGPPGSSGSPSLASYSGAMSARGPYSQPLPSGMGTVASPIVSAAKSPRAPLAIAAILIGLSLLVVAAVLIAGRAKPAAVRVVGADGAPTVVEQKPDDDNKDYDAQIQSGIASIDKGDYATGIATLATLEPDNMNRADVHRALEKGYIATSARKDAMREVALLLKSDPSSANDAKLLEDVRNTAIGKDGATDAFELLESDLGTAGVDLLYEIAHAQWAAEYPQAASRAQRALLKSDVRAKASPALDVALDLRSAGTCDKKKALFQRAAETGDYRALAVLKQLTGTRGCGFLGAKDCWPCMHKDGSLAKTIAALDERTGKK